MTENEALESALKKIIAQEKSDWGYIENFDVDENWAVRTAIEHVKQYRKIGTVKELKEAAKYLGLVKIHGTVGKAIEACAEYEDIGTVEELKKIKEKDIAKPVIKNSNGVFCPVCLYWINHRQYVINAGEDHPNRCEWCGQKLKWEETDED